jgi:hypothetical protein
MSTTWEKLYISISNAKSSAVKTDVLSQFCYDFDGGGMEEIGGRHDHKAMFVAKVCELLRHEYDAQQTDFSLLLKIVDSLRICAREKIGLGPLTTRETLTNVVALATQKRFESKTLTELTLRCLNNAVYMEDDYVAERLIDLSDSHSCCLLDDVMSLIVESTAPTTVHFALRFLLMVTSQCRSVNSWISRNPKQLLALVNALIFSTNRMGIFGVFEEDPNDPGGEGGTRSRRPSRSPSSPAAVLIEWERDSGGWLSSDDENIVIETIKVLQALDLTWLENGGGCGRDSSFEHLLVRLESVLCHLLGLGDSYPDTTAATNLIVRQVIHLAMFLSTRSNSTLPEILSSSMSSTKSLVNLFSTFYDDVYKKVSRERHQQTEETRTLALSPILSLLTNCSTKSLQFRLNLREHVLCSNADDAESKNDDATTSESKRDRERFDNLAPKYYASPTSIRGKLLKLMTSIDTLVKRYASELMFELCDQNTQLFVEWAGMGNCISFLQSKGLA